MVDGAATGSSEGVTGEGMGGGGADRDGGVDRGDGGSVIVDEPVQPVVATAAATSRAVERKALRATSSDYVAARKAVLDFPTKYLDFPTNMVYGQQAQTRTKETR
jgi:hypothetical protein